VTCLAYSDDDLTMHNGIIVSGSLDATVLVWIWDQKGHHVMGSADSTGTITTLYNGDARITRCILEIKLFFSKHLKQKIKKIVVNEF